MDSQLKKKKRQQVQKIQFHQLQEYANFQGGKDDSDHEPLPQRKKQPLTQSQIQHRQKLYMKSKFQFVSLYPKDVRWDDVQQVIYATTHEITCPICMNDTYEITIPYMTPCGHVYCLPCFLRHKSLSKFNQKCPLCGELAVASELKSVKLIKQKVRTVGEIIIMNQIQKYKNDHELYLEGKESITYARTLVVNQSYVAKLLEQEIQQLQNLAEYCDQELLPSVQQSVEFVLMKQEKLQQCNEEPQVILSNMPKKDENIQRFYQDSSGQLGFLHPLCNKYINIQFGHDKTVIESKLLQVDKFIQSENTQKRYKFLSHIPLHTEIYFYEIDLKNILNQDNLDKYQFEMMDYRHRQNKELQRQEEKYNIQLGKQASKQSPEHSAGYFYVNKFQEDFEFNEQDFPELPPLSTPNISEQNLESPLQEVKQNAQKIEQPNQQQQQKQNQQEVQFNEESQFPKLSEESSQLLVNPYAETWGKVQQQEPPEVKPQETIKLSDLDFHVVIKQKNRKRKQVQKE